MKMKTMRYKGVIVTRRGSADALKIIENDLHSPLAGEAKANRKEDEPTAAISESLRV